MKLTPLPQNPFKAIWLASQAENRAERDNCMRYARTAWWPDNRARFVAVARQRNRLAVRAGKYARGDL